MEISFEKRLDYFEAQLTKMNLGISWPMILVSLGSDTLANTNLDAFTMFVRSREWDEVRSADGLAKKLELIRSIFDKCQNA
jgi:hypothetical protein